MTIFGRDYGFLLTVGAAAEIADLCPDGDITQLGEVLGGRYSNTIRVTAKMSAALSRGFESAKAFEDPGYVPHPLTEAMVMALPQDTFLALQNEAVAAYTASMKTTVEAEVKKKNAETAAL